MLYTISHAHNVHPPWSPCVHTQLEEHQRALADYSAALEVDPGNAHSHYNRGIVLDRLGVSALGFRL